MQLYPEKAYFQRSIIIGNLPRSWDLNELFVCFDDISFWKLNSKVVIPDLRSQSLKAVILTFDDEESARICFCSFSFKTISSITFIPYSGTSLFYVCKQLNIVCDSRCRNVLISGIDSKKSKETYLDILKAFGKISYIEFCPEGDIPKIRVEFTRASSAFAAVLCLKTKLGEEALITLEMPLFPISPIAKPSGRVKKTSPGSVMKEETNEQPLRTMNIYEQDQQHTFTNVFANPENVIYQRDTFEEYMMEDVFFGHRTRKLTRESLNCTPTAPELVKNYLNRNTQENIKRFLQSRKKIMSVFGMK